MSSTLKEFKPALIFLAKFLGIYLLLNLAYGFFIESYEPFPDPVTQYVSTSTCVVLNNLGYSTTIAPHPARPAVILRNYGNSVIAVYEGCNSMNVMIVFVAFMSAFGNFSKKKLWFIVAGLVAIFVLNLVRVTFLFWVAEAMPENLYFMHKYVFTIFIYAVVLMLWYLWIFRCNERSAKPA